MAESATRRLNLAISISRADTRAIGAIVRQLRNLNRAINQSATAINAFNASVGGLEAAAGRVATAMAAVQAKVPTAGAAVGAVAKETQKVVTSTKRATKATYDYVSSNSELQAMASRAAAADKIRLSQMEKKTKSAYTHLQKIGEEVDLTKSLVEARKAHMAVTSGGSAIEENYARTLNNSIKRLSTLQEKASYYSDTLSKSAFASKVSGGNLETLNKQLQNNFSELSKQIPLVRQQIQQSQQAYQAQKQQAKAAEQAAASELKSHQSRLQSATDRIRNLRNEMEARSQLMNTETKEQILQKSALSRLNTINTQMELKKRAAQDEINSLNSIRNATGKTNAITEKRIANYQKEIAQTTAVQERLKGLVDRSNQYYAAQKAVNGVSVSNLSILDQMSRGLNRVVATQLKYFGATILIFGALAKIQQAFRSTVELSDEVARSLTVSRSVLIDVKDRYTELSNAIVSTSRRTGASIAQTGESLYQLGSAGLKVEQSMAALNSVMNLVVATDADVNKTTKILAGTYILLGDSLESVGNTAARFARIADVMAAAYRDNIIELKELNDGLKFALPVAKRVGLTFEETTGILSFLNNNMIKAGEAGRALRVIFSRMTTDLDKFAAQFGIAMDPNAPLNFLDIMRKVGQKMQDGALTAAQVGVIFERMGLRGANAFILMAKEYDTMEGIIKSLGERAAGSAERMARRRIESDLGQLKVFTQNFLDYMRIAFAPIFGIILGVVKAFNTIAAAIKDTPFETAIKYTSAFTVALLSLQGVLAAVTIAQQRWTTSLFLSQAALLASSDTLGVFGARLWGIVQGNLGIASALSTTGTVLNKTNIALGQMSFGFMSASAATDQLIVSSSKVGTLSKLVAGATGVFKGFGSVVLGVLKSIGAALVKLGSLLLTALLNPYTLLALAIAGVVYALYRWIYASDIAIKKNKELIDQIKEDELNRLNEIEAIQKAIKQTEDMSRALKEGRATQYQVNNAIQEAVNIYGGLAAAAYQSGGSIDVFIQKSKEQLDMMNKLQEADKKRRGEVFAENLALWTEELEKRLVATKRLRQEMEKPEVVFTIRGGEEVSRREAKTMEERNRIIENTKKRLEELRKSNLKYVETMGAEIQRNSDVAYMYRQQVSKILELERELLALEIKARSAANAFTILREGAQKFADITFSETVEELGQVVSGLKGLSTAILFKYDVIIDEASINESQKKIQDIIKKISERSAKTEIELLVRPEIAQIEGNLVQENLEKIFGTEAEYKESASNAARIFSSTIRKSFAAFPIRPGANMFTINMEDYRALGEAIATGNETVIDRINQQLSDQIEDIATNAQDAALMQQYLNELFQNRNKLMQFFNSTLEESIQLTELFTSLNEEYNQVIGKTSRERIDREEILNGQLEVQTKQIDEIKKRMMAIEDVWADIAIDQGDVTAQEKEYRKELDELVKSEKERGQTLKERIEYIHSARLEEIEAGNQLRKQIVFGQNRSDQLKAERELILARNGEQKRYLKDLFDEGFGLENTRKLRSADLKLAAELEANEREIRYALFEEYKTIKDTNDQLKIAKSGGDRILQNQLKLENSAAEYLFLQSETIKIKKMIEKDSRLGATLGKSVVLNEGKLNQIRGEMLTTLIETNRVQQEIKAAAYDQAASVEDLNLKMAESAQYKDDELITTTKSNIEFYKAYSIQQKIDALLFEEARLGQLNVDKQLELNSLYQEQANVWMESLIEKQQKLNNLSEGHFSTVQKINDVYGDQLSLISEMGSQLTEAITPMFELDFEQMPFTAMLYSSRALGRSLLNIANLQPQKTIQLLIEGWKEGTASLQGLTPEAYRLAKAIADIGLQERQLRQLQEDIRAQNFALALAQISSAMRVKDFDMANKALEDLRQNAQVLDPRTGKINYRATYDNLVLIKSQAQEISDAYIQAADGMRQEIVSLREEMTNLLNETKNVIEGIINSFRQSDVMREFANRLESIVNQVKSLDGVKITLTVDDAKNILATLGVSIPGRQFGGFVPGYGGGDTVGPIMVERGEYVVPKEAVAAIGPDFFETARRNPEYVKELVTVNKERKEGSYFDYFNKMEDIRKAKAGGLIPGYQEGGYVVSPTGPLDFFNWNVREISQSQAGELKTFANHLKEYIIGRNVIPENSANLFYKMLMKRIYTKRREIPPPEFDLSLETMSAVDEMIYSNPVLSDARHGFTIESVKLSQQYREAYEARKAKVKEFAQAGFILNDNLSIWNQMNLPDEEFMEQVFQFSRYQKRKPILDDLWNANILGYEREQSHWSDIYKISDNQFKNVINGVRDQQFDYLTYFGLDQEAANELIKTQSITSVQNTLRDLYDYLAIYEPERIAGYNRFQEGGLVRESDLPDISLNNAAFLKSLVDEGANMLLKRKEGTSGYGTRLFIEQNYREIKSLRKLGKLPPGIVETIAAYGDYTNDEMLDFVIAKKNNKLFDYVSESFVLQRDEFVDEFKKRKDTIKELVDAGYLYPELQLEFLDMPNDEFQNYLNLVDRVQFAYLKEYGGIKNFAEVLRQLESLGGRKNIAGYINDLMDAEEQTKLFEEVKARTFLTPQQLDDLEGFASDRLRNMLEKLDEMYGELQMPLETKIAIAGDLTQQFQTGGKVPGAGRGDIVPAMLEPGEFVIPRKVVEKLGVGFFRDMIGERKYQTGGYVQHLALGDVVQKRRPAPEMSMAGFFDNKNLQTAYNQLDGIKKTTEAIAETTKTIEETSKNIVSNTETTPETTAEVEKNISKLDKETTNLPKNFELLKKHLESAQKLTPEFINDLQVIAQARGVDISKWSALTEFARTTKDLEIPPNVITAMQQFAQKTDSTTDVLVSLSQESSTAFGEVTGLIDQFRKGELTAGRTISGIRNVIGSFRSEVSNANKEVVELTRALMQAFGSRVKKMIDSLRATFQRLFSEMLPNMVGTFLDSFIQTQLDIVKSANEAAKETQDSYYDSRADLVEQLKRNEISYFDYFNRLEDLNKETGDSMAEQQADAEAQRIAAIGEAITDITSQIIDEAKKWIDAFDEFFSDVVDGFVEIGVGIAGTLGDAFGMVGQLIETAVTSLGAVGGAAGGGGIAAALGGLLGTTVAPGVGTAIGAGAGVAIGAIVGGAVGSVLETAIPIVGDIVKAFEQMASAAVKGILDLIPYIVKLGTMTEEEFANMFGGFYTDAKGVRQEIEYAQSVMGLLPGDIIKFTQMFAQRLPDIVKKLEENIPNIINALLGGMVTLADGTVQEFEGAIPAVFRVISENLGRFVDLAVPNVLRFIETIVGLMPNLFTTIFKTLADTAKTILNGQTITTIFETIMTTIESVLSSASNDLIKPLTDSLKTNLPRIIPIITQTITDSLPVITDAIVVIMNAVGVVLEDPAVRQALIDAIFKLFGAAFDALFKLIPGLDVLLGVLSAIGVVVGGLISILIILVGTALMPFILILSPLIAVTIAANIAIAALAAVIGAVLSPVLALIGGLALLISTIAYAVVLKPIIELFMAFGAIIGKVGEKIAQNPFFQTAFTRIQSALDKLGQAFTKLMKAIAPAAPNMDIVDAIAGGIVGLLQVFLILVDPLILAIELFTKLVDAASAVAESFDWLQLIINLVDYALTGGSLVPSFQMLYDIIVTVNSFISTTFNATLTTMKTMFEGIYNTLKTVGDYLATTFKPVFDELSKIWKSISDFLTSTFIKAWNDISTAVSSVYQPIKDLVDFINGALTTAFNTFKETLQTIIDMFPDVPENPPTVPETPEEAVGRLDTAVDRASSGDLLGAGAALLGMHKGGIFKPQEDPATQQIASMLGLRPNEGLALLLQGEGILTKAGVNAIGGLEAIQEFNRGRNPYTDESMLMSREIEMPAWFAQMFHKGGIFKVPTDAMSRQFFGMLGLRPNEGLALLQEGEGILTKAGVNAMGEDKLAEFNKGNNPYENFSIAEMGAMQIAATSNFPFQAMNVAAQASAANPDAAPDGAPTGGTGTGTYGETNQAVPPSNLGRGGGTGEQTIVVYITNDMSNSNFQSETIAEDVENQIVSSMENQNGPMYQQIRSATGTATNAGIRGQQR